MKRYIEKQEEETTNEISDWVGIEFYDFDIKGIILYTGSKYHIICNNTYGRRNDVCGNYEYDGESIKDTIDKWKNDILPGIKIKSIYCFDSYKELMTWFADGIKG